MRTAKRIGVGVFIAVVMAIGLLGLPSPASAECVPIPNDIWSLPPELIVWYFYWSFPGLVEEAASILGTYDPWPIIVWVIEHSCAWG